MALTKISTEIVDGNIVQMLDERVIYIVRVQDSQIRDALIKMGWTPPAPSQPETDLDFKTQEQIAAVFAHHVVLGTATPEMERQLLEFLRLKEVRARAKVFEIVPYKGAGFDAESITVPPEFIPQERGDA
jgi:hypothetical protein